MLSNSRRRSQDLGHVENREQNVPALSLTSKCHAAKDAKERHRKVLSAFLF